MFGSSIRSRVTGVSGLAFSRDSSPYQQPLLARDAERVRLGAHVPCELPGREPGPECTVASVPFGR